MGCNYLQPVFCRFLCLDGIKHGVLPPCHLCAALMPTLLHYTRYITLLILGFLQPHPLYAARYRPYRASQILENCEQK